jgi:hypothetical protein
MERIGLPFRSQEPGSLTVGDEVKGAVFDIGQSGFVEGQSPVAGMIQSLRRDRIVLGQP